MIPDSHLAFMVPTNFSNIREPIENLDFVLLFPPELSNTLFLYVSDEDLYSCCKTSILWRNTINNDQQWSKRCLRRGWTFISTLNEALTWQDLSHVKKTHKPSFRASPQFNPLFSLKKIERLDSICDWAIYYRKRIILEKNWKQGVYVVQTLTVPESETEIFVMSSSAFNQRYLAVGTTLGNVFLWSVTGVPELVFYLQPPLKGDVEVEKVYMTAAYLVILYHGGFVRVLKECDEQDRLFQVVYQTKVCYGFFGEDSDFPKFQLEATSRANHQTDVFDDLTGNSCYLKLFNDMFSSQYENADEEDELNTAETLFFANENIVVFSKQNSRCFVTWNLRKGLLEDYMHTFPESFMSLEMFLSNHSCIFSVHQSLGESIHFKYAVLVYCAKSLASTKVVPLWEIMFPASVDEIHDECNGKKFAVCNQDGIIAAYDVSKKTDLFLENVGSCVDNLTTSEELIFFHIGENRLIAALFWTGEYCYKIVAHIGPVKEMSCHGPYLVSGAAVRELIVWDKLSGKKLHKVYHQPSFILNVFVSPTSILTVGRDNPPTMIGYL